MRAGSFNGGCGGIGSQGRSIGSKGRSAGWCGSDKDARAYAFAKREADLQAARRDVGHFLGIAPGCTGAGVGDSFSTNSPNHCTFNDKALVARAFAIGRDGKVYWSAQYR